jgi:hypothetical protein
MFLVVSAHMKGALLMTTLPLIDCAEMLAIDAKTLRHWLRQANIPLHHHPSDARVKCLTMEHVQQLAALHGRALKPHATPSTSLREQVLLEAPLVPTNTALALGEIPVIPPETDLLKKLSQLETQVATMQQHLAELALELLQERTLRYEQRLQMLETLIGATQHPSVQPPARQRMDEQIPPEEGSHTQRRLPQTKPPAPCRLIPLIEYAADGTYVVICPERGELPLLPDSPAWFDWLATLSSLRFVGQQGRLSAYRKPGRTFCWFAYRRIHRRRYEYALGRTDHLTIDCLERMAARLQSPLASL